MLAGAATLFAQNRAGNFVIRFEPDAVLQANAVVPFAIHVTDDRRNPVLNAKVTLQIETPGHTQVKVYNAPGVEPGVYEALPVFPSAGSWTVYVEVRQEGLTSARTIDFNVTDSIKP